MLPPSSSLSVRASLRDTPFGRHKKNVSTPTPDLDVAYLDYAATAPMPEHVLNAWAKAVRGLAATPGNPSALHSGGRAAKRTLEDARERIAQCLGAQRAEVILTSGATESAALGVVAAARGQRARDPQRTIVYLSHADHDAVAHQQSILEEDGFEVRFFALDSTGVCVIDESVIADQARIALLTMPLVSSEIGTIQPLEELARIRDANATDSIGEGTIRLPLIHADGAQALHVIDVDFSSMGIDLLTLGGHKVGAPVGTGVLLVKRGIPMVTDRPGGGHERGIRSGTPDVAGAVALATALETVVSSREEGRAHLEEIRDYLLARLPEGVSATVPAELASPGIVHLSIPTTHPEAVLMAMDMAGVMVSAGSACHANVTRPSTMVMAMGKTADEALGVLRVSTGAGTTHAHIDRFIAALPMAIQAGQRLDARDARKREIGQAVLANDESDQVIQRTEVAKDNYA